MEHSKRTMGTYGTIGGMLEHADKFYAWLQDAPMKDEDNKFWLDGTTKTTPNGKNK
jgi:hypothetical protein